jgi:uncharacterized protein (TIGR02453 family)
MGKIVIQVYPPNRVVAKGEKKVTVVYLIGHNILYQKTDQTILILLSCSNESEKPMQTALDLGLALRFLGELGQNNNKAWFDQHRSDYEAVRGVFYQFIDDLIDEFRVSDSLGGLSAKECVARIYRDIRFSKDKSPYKTNLSAIVAPGGWKTDAFGYFVSLGPRSQSMVAGGLHEPSPEQLNRFRQAIDIDAAKFRQVTHAREFIENFGAVEGERLKSAPKGYDREHPEIELLQLKQITVIHRFSDEEVVRPDFGDRVATTCRAMKPFLNYLESILR